VFDEERGTCDRANAVPKLQTWDLTAFAHFRTRRPWQKVGTFFHLQGISVLRETVEPTEFPVERKRSILEMIFARVITLWKKQMAQCAIASRSRM
jgi:hypothetical protein